MQPPQNILYYAALQNVLQPAATSECTTLYSSLKTLCTVQPSHNVLHYAAPTKCTALCSPLEYTPLHTPYRMQFTIQCLQNVLNCTPPFQVYFVVQSSSENTLLHSLLQNVFHYTTLLSLCLLYSPLRLYLALHLTSYVTLP